MTELDLRKLRGIAEAAPYQESTVIRHDLEGGAINHQVVLGPGRGTRQLHANTFDLEGPGVRAWAAHLAAFSPPVVLALLDRIEELERSGGRHE